MRHARRKYILLLLLVASAILILSRLLPAQSTFLQSSRFRKKVRLIIMIISAQRKRAERDTIRSTWIRLSPRQFSDIDYRFLIGDRGYNAQTLEALRNEGDDVMLLHDVDDSYSALTTKVLAGVSAIWNQFDVDYLLKVDDDSFVNIPALLDELRTLEEQGQRKASRLYWGYFAGGARVKKTGPWAENEWVLCDHYLPYARGGGYLLGRELIEFIAKNRDILKVYANEDVAMGAWLAGLDVWYEHDRRFDTEFRSRGCSNEYLVTHKQSRAGMQQLFNNRVTKGHLCDPETGNFRSYSYNWDVPPSQCCVPDMFDVQNVQHDVQDL